MFLLVEFVSGDTVVFMRDPLYKSDCYIFKSAAMVLVAGAFYANVLQCLMGNVNMWLSVFTCDCFMVVKPALITSCREFSPTQKTHQSGPSCLATSEITALVSLLTNEEVTFLWIGKKKLSAYVCGHASLSSVCTELSSGSMSTEVD